MIQNERDIRHEMALQAAQQMMVAARTAPKAKGVDLIEIGLATDAEKQMIVDEMRRIAETDGLKFFLRDAGNVEAAEAVVLIGTREEAIGLNCGRCGFPLCTSRTEGVPCAFNSVDVGIAVGSACRTAMNLCVDTRVMYSAGRAAQQIGMPTAASRQVIAIPVSISSKSPFFDRK